MAKTIIILGLCITLVGLVYYFLGDYLQWIGNLPGDIKIKKDNFSFYFPITTMLLFSLLFFLITRLIHWISN